HGEQRPTIHRFAFADVDFQQYTAGGRGHFRIDFIRTHFQQRLELVVGISFALKPARHGSFDDALAKLGHDDVGWHNNSSSSKLKVQSEKWVILPYFQLFTFFYSIPRQFPYCVGNRVRVGHEKFLHGMAVGNAGHIGSGQAANGSIEIFERLVCQHRRDLRAVAERPVVLVHDQRLARLFHRVDHRRFIQRQQGTKVYHFHVDTVALGDLFGGLQRVMRHHAVGKHREVAPLTGDTGGTDGDGVIVLWYITFDGAIALFRLEEQHWIRVTHGAFQ